MHRVAVFIDGWNFAKATFDGYGARIDFKKFLASLVKEDEHLIRAHYYLGLTPSFIGSDTIAEERKKQTGFIRFLCRNGYKVVSKPCKVFADGSRKANLDLELATDMIETAFQTPCDRMVLVSGDSDFIPVIQAVQRRGVRVTVVAAQAQYAYDHGPGNPRPFPAKAADDLLDAADEAIDLGSMIEEIRLHENATP